MLAANSNRALGISKVEAPSPIRNNRMEIAPTQLSVGPGQPLQLNSSRRGAMHRFVTFYM